MNDSFDDKETLHVDLSKPTVVLLVIFSVIGVIGNAVILMVYWKLVKMTTTQFLIFVIAIFDFLTASVAVPSSITLWIYQFRIQTGFFCKWHIAIINICILPGIFLVFIVTFVRYCHVCRPNFLYRIERRIKAICVSSVILGLSFSLMDALNVPWLPPSLSKPNQACELKEEHFIFDLVKNLIILFNIIALLIMNILIIRTNIKTGIVKRSMSQMKRNKSQESVTQRENVGKSKSLHEFFELLDENPISRDHLKNQSTRHQLNKNDNSKGNEDRTSIADTLQDRRDRTSKPENLLDKKSIVGSNSTDETHHSYKSNINQDDQPTSMDIDDDIKDDMSLHRSISKKKKSGRLSNQSFKGLSKTTAMLLIVSVVFVLSYLPLIILQLGNVTDDETQPYNIRKYVIRPAWAMYYVSCCANPMIYTFVNPSFRSKCRALFILKQT